MIQFENLGYFKEFYFNNKFIGTIKSTKDRETIGYYGKISETLTENIVLENKKVLKKGSNIHTLLYPLCGKRIIK